MVEYGPTGRVNGLAWLCEKIIFDGPLLHSAGGALLQKSPSGSRTLTNHHPLSPSTEERRGEALGSALRCSARRRSSHPRRRLALPPDSGPLEFRAAQRLLVASRRGRRRRTAGVLPALLVRTVRTEAVACYPACLPARVVRGHERQKQQLEDTPD